MLSRRTLLTGTAAAAVVATLAYSIARREGGADARTQGEFEIRKTEAEWKNLLSPAQYAVLRGHGTERAHSSQLDREKREGLFACAGCDLPVYASDAKFDSGTGWPSFTRALVDAVGTQIDTSFFMTRTEVHCRRCGGHLGHIFDDGPPPTGKRHCLNGIALKFIAA